MHALAAQDLEGLDPTAEDKDNDTPTDNFYRHRDLNCTLIRPPFVEEEDVWWDLMESACRQNNIDFDTFEPEWWDYYQQRIQNQVKALPDEDEGVTARAEDDATASLERDGDLTSSSSQHDRVEIDRETQDRIDDHAVQQGQEDGDEDFADALEDQPKSGEPSSADRGKGC